VIPLLPEPARTIATAPPVPERVVEFLLERPKPPPEPPPAVELPRPDPPSRNPRRSSVRAPCRRRRPRSTRRRTRARKAAASGLLALSDQLAELRNLEVERDRPAQSLDQRRASGRRSTARSSPARTGEGSGGIAVAAASRGFGGGAGTMTEHRTAKVEAGTAAAPAAEAKRSGRSSQASRTREEVELVFDRNKSAIYAIYARALRDNPALAGKVVLEVTIAPSGESPVPHRLERSRRRGARAQAGGAREDVPLRGARTWRR